MTCSLDLGHVCALLRDGPFNFQGGGYVFFLKKYSDSQCCWKNILILAEEKKSDSELLSNNLMLNSGKKKFALCVTKKINILTLVLSEKRFLNETNTHSPPLQVKWSVPKKSLKIPKGQSEPVNRRRIDNTMAKKKKDKQRSTQHYTDNERSRNTNPLFKRVKLICSGRVTSSCSIDCFWNANFSSISALSWRGFFQNLLCVSCANKELLLLLT